VLLPVGNLPVVAAHRRVHPCYRVANLGILATANLQMDCFFHFRLLGRVVLAFSLLFLGLVLSLGWCGRFFLIGGLAFLAGLWRGIF